MQKKSTTHENISTTPSLLPPPFFPLHTEEFFVPSESCVVHDLSFLFLFIISLTTHDRVYTELTFNVTT